METAGKKQIELYSHNKIAYDAAISMLAKTGKAAVIHPTGTGKSYIAFKLAADNPDSFICWMSPSEYIFKTQLENLAVGGTDIPQNIVFYTYAKLMLMREEEIAEICPNYIVLDEFHRCGAEMWGQGVQNLLEMYEGVPVLGLSATNIRYLDNQRDMADELFDGNIASYITLGEAVVRGILNPPAYVTALYSHQKEYERYKRRVENARCKAVRDAGERYLEALRHTLEKAQGLDDIFYRNMPDAHGKYILFCSDKTHMDEMISHAGEWFAKVDHSPRIYSVYSADPEASKSFANFKADLRDDHLRLLYCIDALNEGIHLDDVSGVVLFRPTVSPIVFKQQIGRAMSAGQKASSVILDVVDNIGGLYSISALQEEMQAVVQYYQYRGEGRNIVNESFRVTDELHDCKALFDALEGTLSASWDLMYQEAERYYKDHQDLLPRQNYVTENGYCLGQWIHTQRRIRSGCVAGALSEEQIRKLDRIGMCWSGRKERCWETNFQAARNIYIKNGKLSVPADMSALKTWVIRQRQRYRDNKMPDEQYERLSGIGMIWDFDDVWEDFYEMAAAYSAEHKSLDIPAAYVTESGVKLGRWYRSMRGLYRDGRLSQEKQKRLEDIGMNWNSIKARTWMRYYAAAESYYARNGNLHIGSTYKTTDGMNLGVWISGQRYSYSLGRLPKGQTQLLEKIGMDWQRFESKWDEGFAHCTAFYAEYGNLDAAVGYMTQDGFRLGTWLAAQRSKYRGNKLTQEQIARLESLNIRWDVMDSDWLNTFALLKKYLAAGNTFDAAQTPPAENGYLLQGWMANQRSRRKAGKLAAWKIAKLDAIGFPWRPQQDRWEIGYAQAKAYYRSWGNLSVPQNYKTEDAFALGTWVSTQRRRYTQGKLEPQQIERLNQIGFLWVPRNTAWTPGPEKREIQQGRREEIA